MEPKRKPERGYGSFEEPEAASRPLAPSLIRAAGLAWNHVDVGPGDAPAIVLLPGVVATHRYFRRNIPPLSERFRVIAPDLPGFGQSEKPDAPYSTEWFVARLLEFLDVKGIARAHVVGNSLGGQIAMALALAAPERVLRLVLIAPAGFTPYPAALSRVLDVAGRAAFPRVGLPRLPRIPSAAIALLFRLVYPTRPDLAESYTRGYVAGVASPDYPLFVRAAFRSLRGSLEEPMMRRAADLTQPTLVMWGAQDHLLPARTAALLSRTISGAELLVYDESGHCPMVDQAERVNRDLAAFLDGKKVGV